MSTRPHIRCTLDMDGEDGQSLAESISTLKGIYDVNISPIRDTRSSRQNRFYWGCLIDPFHRYLSQQDAEHIDREQAHYWLKAKCLPPKRLIDPETGEIVETVADSHTLTVEEFSLFIERCRKWLLTHFDIRTESPGDL